MNSTSTTKSYIRGQNDDEDCEVIYNKADSPVIKEETFTMVTEKLAIEGLEIIKEVPSRSTDNKKMDGDRMKNKRPMEAGNYEGEDNEDASSKKQKIIKSSSSARRRSSKSGKRTKHRGQKTDSNQITSTQIMVPNHLVGTVIGKKGSMINGITGTSGARVNFLDWKDNMPDHRICVVTGTHSQVEAACILINNLLNSILAPRNIPGVEDIEIVKEYRSSSVQTLPRFKEGTETLMRDMKQEFVSSASNCTEVLANQLPYERQIFEPQAGPSNVNVNTAEKKKNSKGSKAVNNGKGKAKQGTGRSAKGVKRAFVSDTSNSTEVGEDQPPSKRQNFEPQAGPSNVNVKTAQKKKKNSQAKNFKLAKAFNNAKRRVNQLKKKKTIAQKRVQNINPAQKRSALQHSQQISMPVDRLDSPFRIKEEPFNKEILDTETGKECDLFAISVASELKKINNEYELQVAKFKINEILFLATTGNLLNDSTGS